jgi:Fe2+ or Zn2+ uptake regulation protein
VLLGRLDQAKTWTCEKCGNVTDLHLDHHRKRLEHARNTADQLDKQARQRGDTVVRSDD